MYSVFWRSELKYAEFHEGLAALLHKFLWPKFSQFFAQLKPAVKMLPGQGHCVYVVATLLTSRQRLWLICFSKHATEREKSRRFLLVYRRKVRECPRLSRFLPDSSFMVALGQAGMDFQVSCPLCLQLAYTLRQLSWNKSAFCGLLSAFLNWFFTTAQNEAWRGSSRKWLLWLETRFRKPGRLTFALFQLSWPRV